MKLIQTRSLGLVVNPRGNSGECDLGFVGSVHMSATFVVWIRSSYYCRAQMTNPFRTGCEHDLWFMGIERVTTLMSQNLFVVHRR